MALTSSCSQEDLITAWKNECENIYGNVLIDNVDKERWMQALHTASRKKLNKSQACLFIQFEIFQAFQCNTIRYDTRYGTIYDTIQRDTTRYDTIRYDAKRYDTIYDKR